MIRKAISKSLRRMTGCTSGNATLLVALGMPVLIGGAGLGVDLSQWYMWKRELQFAVDQAAIAGAWARADDDTAATYITRAQQEFSANLSVTEDFATTPTVQLANFSNGTLNSVTVSATASKELPFSSLLTGSGATISAYAQATFEEGTTFTSCLIAIDEDETGAITIGGNVVLLASCGMAALSNADIAIAANGNPQVDAGWLLARGGIDDWFKENTDDVILEHMDGLVDPFADLDAPEPEASKVNRTYSCRAQADTVTADITTRVQTNYTYWRGRNTNTLTTHTYATPKQNSTTQNTATSQLVAAGTTAGSTSHSVATFTQLGGSGANKIYEKKEVVTTRTTSNVVVTPGGAAGNVVPGTYADIHVGCDTTFSPGIYIIDGGGVKITGQYEVTGSAVMFVLKNGAWIDIAGGAKISLTAMQVADLRAAGLSEEDANDLAGMLVFEDRASAGSSKTKINGNASTILNGTMYFPVSQVNFAGTAGVTSQCLMIAADTIVLTGSANMTTFCPTGSTQDDIVATTASKVRLVA